MDEQRAQLRAEVLRQMHGQLERWQEILTQAPAGPPMLTSPTDRAWFHGCLDQLRQAGEEVPQAFYRRGSLIPKSHEAGREAAGISLNALVADLIRALASFTDEADDDPGAAMLAEE